MTRRDKSKGNRYTASEKARALKLYEEYGPSQTSRRTGIPYETLRRWARSAGVVSSTDNKEKIAAAHAAIAQRVHTKWAEMREAEADLAGQTAVEVRERLQYLLDGDDAQMIRAVTAAYDTLITKAELLSGQATDRIAVWAEADLDRELKDLVKKLEGEKRQELTASQKMLLAPDEIIIDADEVETEPVIVDEP